MTELRGQEDVVDVERHVQARIDALRDALAASDEARLREVLEELRPSELADHWDALEVRERHRVVEALPGTTAAELASHLPEDELRSLLETLPVDRTRDLLADLDPDDLADAVQVLMDHDAARAREAVKLLGPAARRHVRTLVRYEPEAAGGLMTPEFVALQATMTVDEALGHLRREAPAAETIYYVFVVDASDRLQGVLSLRQLVVADPSTPVERILDPDVIFVRTGTDQEEVARLMSDYDLPVLPVVDARDRLVGIVTVDDVLDVLELEATEDIHRLGAAPVDIDYARAKPWLLFRKRIPWLVFLVVSMTFTFNVISHFEDVLAEVVILAAFIPLLIGTGGNVGAQVATLVVRALGTRELDARDYPRVLRKEIGTGLLMGLAFGLFIAGYVLFFEPTLRLALAVGLTMMLITLAANLVGASLPFLFRKLNVDPALTSSPGITTVMDVAGLLIYFNVVILILGL